MAKTFLHSNLKVLRNRSQKTLEQLAADLDMKVSKLKSYEYTERQNPDLEFLFALSDYFGISVDSLLRVDLSRLSELQMRQLEAGNDVFLKGSQLRVLAITVNQEEQEQGQLVPLKAKAGYTAGYNDPEYIGTLPSFSLPMLSTNKTYRMFQLDGDSMKPIPHGAYVIGEYVSNWNDVKDGQAYILLTREEGMVFKVLYNQVRKKKNFLLRSLNPEYEPYQLPVEEVLEIWRFVNYISSELPEGLMSAGSFEQQVIERLNKVENKLAELV